MFAYKTNELGIIIEELVDPKVIPAGFLVLEKRLDASIHMIVNGSIMLKPVEVPQVPRPQPRIQMTNEQKLYSIREQRDSLLRQTDWTQTLDCPLSLVEQDAYRAYRKALREMISNAGLDLDHPVFPTKP